MFRACGAMFRGCGVVFGRCSAIFCPGLAFSVLLDFASFSVPWLSPLRDPTHLRRAALVSGRQALLRGFRALVCDRAALFQRRRTISDACRALCFRRRPIFKRRRGMIFCAPAPFSRLQSHFSRCNVVFSAAASFFAGDALIFARFRFHAHDRRALLGRRAVVCFAAVCISSAPRPVLLDSPSMVLWGSALCLRFRSTSFAFRSRLRGCASISPGRILVCFVFQAFLFRVRFISTRCVPMLDRFDLMFHRCDAQCSGRDRASSGRSAPRRCLLFYNALLDSGEFFSGPILLRPIPGFSWFSLAIAHFVAQGCAYVHSQYRRTSVRRLRIDPTRLALGFSGAAF